MIEKLKKICVVIPQNEEKNVRFQRCQCRINHKRKDC